MFKTLILVCLFNTECVELHDDRGPYKTEVECKARAAEMMSDFVSANVTPPVTTLKFKCDKSKGQNI
jgi:hypothetical protein